MANMLIRMALVLLGGSALAAAAPATTAASGETAQGGFYAAPAEEGVYVPDSSAALEALALAQRMAGRGQWDSAGSLMQEVLEKYADKVAPQRLDAQGKVEAYVGIAAAVHDRIARWPAEGRQAYATRYEPEAHRRLAKAGRDWDKLHALVWRYLETSSGRAAALRLMDLRIERGDFHAAIWLGDRLLAWTSAGDRGEILFRLGWAAHLAGQDEAAHGWLNELKKIAPPLRGTVRGKSVELAAALGQMLETPVSLSAHAPEDWPLPGGSPDRGRLAPAVASIGQKLFAVPLPQPTSSMNRQEEAPPQEMRLGIMPVVVGNALYFQDGRRVYGLDLNSGLPLSGWASTYAAQGARFELPAPAGGLSTGPMTVTVGPDAVFAVMGGGLNPLQPFGRQPREGSTTRLVCLDRQTGQERWTLSPEGLKMGAAMKSMEFSGNPIVAGDRVYVLGRGDSGNFESCYAICLDARSGERLWVRYIAGAATAGAVFRMESGEPSPVSYPALMQGRLFVAGENGAVAALDATDGSVRWLSLYARRATERQERQRDTAQRLLRPWSANPVIAQGGQVFVLPSDGQDLMVFDAGSGREVRRIPLSQLGEADTLLGIRGNWIILTGQRRAWAVNWKDYDPKAKNLSRVIVKSADLSAVRGRGVVTADSVYVPTERQLKRLSLAGDLAERGFMVVESHPAYDGVWGQGEGPGNVVAAEDHLIVAGADQVSVYADWGRVSLRMHEAIEAAPEDRDLRLRYAQALLAAGRTKEGLEQIDRVIADLGGAGSMRAGAGRTSLFDAIMAMAHRAVKSNDGTTAEQLLGRAVNAAQTAGEQVEYLLARADLAHHGKQWGTEVAMLQSVLSDRDLRGVAVSPPADAPNAAPVFAGDVARQRIGVILRMAEGEQAYAEFGKTARAQFEQARTLQDPEALRRVAEVYPNAAVADRALWEAAQAYEGRGNLILAKEMLKGLLLQGQTGAEVPEGSQANDSISRPRVLVAMARLYVRLNDPLAAAARLREAARLDPAGRLKSPLPLSGGGTIQPMGYAEAATAIERQIPPVSERFPSFQIDKAPGGKPFAEAKEARVEGVEALIHPLRGHERWDRVVGWSKADGIVLIQPGQKHPVAKVTFSSRPEGCAWRGEYLSIWSEQELACLDGAMGKVIWRWTPAAGSHPIALAQAPAMASSELPKSRAEPPVPRAVRQRPVMVRRGGMNAGVVRFRVGAAAQLLGDVPVVQPPQQSAGAERIAQVQPAGDRLVVATTKGRLICLDGGTGNILWRRSAGQQPIERILANGDFIVVRSVGADEQKLIALNAFDGREIFRRGFGESESTGLMNVALAPQGVLVFTTGGAIAGKDLYEGGDALTFQTDGRHVRGDQARARPGMGGAGGYPYIGMIRPDQLVISGDRILALSDGGQFVRVHSLVNGELLKRRDAEHKLDIPALLSTGTQGWTVSLRTGAHRLYVLDQQNVSCYGVEDATEQWRWESVAEAEFSNLYIGQGILAVLDGSQQGARGMLCFSREELSGGRESGLLRFSIRLPEGSDWEPVEGGFYYVAQGAAHFLRGQ